jgi:hypothetical protein
VTNPGSSINARNEVTHRANGVQIGFENGRTLFA